MGVGRARIKNDDPRPSATRDADGVAPATVPAVGELDRKPWDIRSVDATIRPSGLFEAAELPAPTADPVTHYSPGFEMRVEPLRTASATESCFGPDAK